MIQQIGKPGGSLSKMPALPGFNLYEFKTSRTYSGGTVYYNICALYNYIALFGLKGGDYAAGDVQCLIEPTRLVYAQEASDHGIAVRTVHADFENHTGLIEKSAQTNGLAGCGNFEYAAVNWPAQFLRNTPTSGTDQPPTAKVRCNRITNNSGASTCLVQSVWRGLMLIKRDRLEEIRTAYYSSSEGGNIVKLLRSM